MADIHFKLTADDSDVVRKIEEIQNKVSDTQSKLSKVDLHSVDTAISEVTESVNIQKQVVKELEEEYAKLDKEVQNMSSRGNYVKEGELIGQRNAVGAELEAERQALGGLQQDLENTKNLRQQVKNAIGEQADAEREATQETRESAKAQRELETAVSSLDPALGRGISGFKKLLNAAKAFIATPLGMVIAGVSAALASMMAYFQRSEEGQLKFAEATGYLKGVFDQLMESVINLGEKLTSVFTNPKQAVTDLWTHIKENFINRINATKDFFTSFGSLLKNTFKGNWDEVKQAAQDMSNAFTNGMTDIGGLSDGVKDYVNNVNEAAKKTAELAKQAKQAELTEAQWMVKAAKLEEKKNEARAKLYNTNLSEEERKQAADEYKAAVEEWAKGEKALLQAKYKRQKEHMKIITNSIEDKKMLLELEAQIIRIDAQAKGQLASLVRRTNKLYKDEEAEKYEKDMQDLLKKYTDYNKKREDIEWDFNEKIGNMQAERTKAVLEGDRQAIEKWDKAIDNAYADKAKTLINFDFAELQKNPAYVKAFENLKYASDDTLNYLINEFEKYKDVAAQTFDDPRELAKYTKVIQQMRDELDSRGNPFEKLAEAQQELNKARAEGNQEEVNKAQEKYNKLLEKCRTQVNSLMGALSNLGKEIGGRGGDILQLTAEVGAFIGDTIANVKELGKEGEAALTSVEKASVILAIASAALQLFHAVQAQFDDTEEKERLASLRLEMERYKADMAKIAAEISQSYDTIFGVNAAQHIDNTLEALDKAKTSVIKFYSDATKTIAALSAYSEWQGMRNGKKKDVKKHDIYSEYGKMASALFAGWGLEGTDFENIIVLTEEGGKKLRDYNSELITSAGQLINLTAEGLAKQLEYYDALLGLEDGLTDEERAMIQNARSMVSALYDAKKEMESIASTYVSEIAEEITDSIWEAVENGADAWDTWEEAGANAIAKLGKDMLKSVIMSDWLSQWKDEVSAAIFSKDADTVKETFSMMFEEGKTYMDEWREYAAMWQDVAGSVYEQEASSGAFNGMSQETGDELNGRFTALQISGETISRTASEGLVVMRSLAEVCGQSNGILSDILSQSARANTFLEDIQKYTKACAAYGENIERIATKIQTL